MAILGALSLGAGAAATATARAAALAVPNASLEADADGNGLPDCWEKTGWGTSTGDWTTTTDAHTGSVAIHGEITSYTSGDRKFIIQRSSSCAPTVTAGTSYTLTGWYKSTIPSALVAFWQNAAGTWTLLDTSRDFAPASTWTQASWQTPPLPDGAVALTFGFMIADQGWITADDFALAADSGQPPPPTATTVVSLTFDDGFADQLPAEALLRSHGLRGTFYINSGALGDQDRLTWADVSQIAADGNEIGGHTVSHPDLLSLTADQATAEICDDRAALIQHGFDVRSFAYPFGNWNSSIQAIVAGCGYLSARWTQGIRGSAEWCATSCPYAESIPPADPFALRAAGSITTDWSLDTLEQVVNLAEQNGGGWVIFTFHHVCAACDFYSITQGDFAAFLDWLSAQTAQGTVVRTVGEVIGGDAAPPPPPPPPPPPNAPPTVSLTAPASGATVSGSVTLAASAQDDRQVAEVDFLVDGALVGTASAAPYSYTWSSTGVADGPVQLTARAVDSDGATADASLQVTVDNGAPTGSLTAPGAFLRGTVTLGATVADAGSGVASVSFQRAPAGSGAWTTIASDATSPYSAGWNTGAGSDGAYDLRIVATDRLGHAFVSPATSVRVDNTKPTASIACNGGSCKSTFRRSATVTLSASDSGSGIAVIRYTLDGSAPTASSPTYQGPLVLTSTKRVRWQAWDRAGNASTAGSQTVTVR